MFNNSSRVWILTFLHESQYVQAFGHGRRGKILKHPFILAINKHVHDPYFIPTKLSDERYDHSC